MEHIVTAELKPDDRLKIPLYHKSGEVLLEAGEFLSPEDIKAFGKLGIQEVICLDKTDDRMTFLMDCKYRSLDIEALPDGRTLTKPLTDAHGNIILEADTQINKDLKEMLKKRGMLHVFVKRSEKELQHGVAREFKKFHTKLATDRVEKSVKEEIDNLGLDEAILIQDPRKEVTIRNVEREVMSGGADIRPKGESLKGKLIQRAKKRKQTEAFKASFVEVQDDAISDVRKMFGHFKDRELVDGGLVGELSKKIIAALIRDKDLLLNLLNKDTDNEYLQIHAVNSTIIAINVATSLHYGSEQVLEVAYGALLHNVGMYRIPDKVLNKEGKLTRSEFLEVQKHPSYNLDYLQRIKRIPASVPIVAYQVHERVNRSGYPKQKPGNLIHSFAKIIAVADVYTALTNDRPYRKALSPFRAARMIVDLGANKQLDVEIIRNFLKFVCLFPVGSWVRLNNGHVAKVVSANEEDFTRPVVNIMYDRNLNPMRNYMLDLREEPKLGVVDGLPADSFLDQGVMEGF